jgi:hypothetical protein
MRECNIKLNSSVKFIDFFVHDILDYTILQKDDTNFTKNITVFNIRISIEEILSAFEDKTTMK